MTVKENRLSKYHTVEHIIIIIIILSLASILHTDILDILHYCIATVLFVFF